MRHPLATLLAAMAVGLALAGCSGDGASPVQVPPPDNGPPVPLAAWSWLNPLPQGNHLRGVAARDTRAVAVGEGGVIVIGNPGTSQWRVVPTPVPGLDLNDVGFVTDDLVVAVGVDGTIRSEDGGETWLFTDDTPRLRDLDIRGARVIAVGARTVFSSNGVSFQQGDNFDPETMFGVAFLDDTTAVAVSSTRIFETLNAGRDWAEVAAGSGLTSMRRVAFANRQFGAIAADNPPRILWTDDGGETWSEVEALDNRVRDMTFFGGDLGLLMTHTREIYASGDGGQSWARQGTGTGQLDRTFAAAAFIDHNSFLAVGLNGVIERTDDAGQTWDELSTGHRKGFIDIAFPSASVGVALAAENDSPFVMRSADGGATWREAPAPTGTPRTLAFHNSSLGALLDLNGAVFKTTDGGASWAPTGAGPTTQGFSGLAFLDAGTWITCGEGATVLRTTDGGDSWNVESFDADGPDYYDAAFFPGSDAGVAVGFDGGARTEDGGDTWTDLAAAAPLEVRAVTCPSADVAVAVGRAIHRSGDRGQTWGVVVPGNGGLFFAVAFRGELHGLAVGDGGLTVETLDGGLTWSEVRNEEKALRAVAFRDSRSAVSAGLAGTLLLGTPAEP